MIETTTLHRPIGPSGNACPSICEHHFDNPTDHAQALASAIAEQLRHALAQKGQATLGVSGGRSPIQLFEALRQTALDWSRVRISLCDERCVAEDHPDSNARLVREHLLKEAAAAAQFVSWLPGLSDISTLTPQALVSHARQQLSTFPLPLDVLVLGMGDDGHTASWFAQSAGLAQAVQSTDWVTWVRPAHAPHLRLTLTLSAVLACPNLHLSLAGAPKQRTYAQAKLTERLDLPVSLVLHRAKHIDVWIAD
jgi:6-phosphogluconolactonase